ncbi:MAG: hypothetical protein V4481_02935 [Patescibacteria group bacterium]
MKLKSLRSYGQTLVAVSALAFLITLFAPGSTLCGGSVRCVASAVFSTPFVTQSQSSFDTTVPQSTPQMRPANLPEYSFVPDAIQITAFYMFAIGLLIIIGAEISQPYFLKKLFPKKRRAHRA